MPKQKLTIEITDVDGVHVDDMNILEASQREIGKNLAAETASTDDQDLGLISKKVFDLERK